MSQFTSCYSLNSLTDYRRCICLSRLCLLAFFQTNNWSYCMAGTVSGFGSVLTCQGDCASSSLCDIAGSLSPQLGGLPAGRSVMICFPNFHSLDKVSSLHFEKYCWFSILAWKFLFAFLLGFWIYRPLLKNLLRAFYLYIAFQLFFYHFRNSLSLNFDDLIKMCLNVCLFGFPGSWF